MTKSPQVTLVLPVYNPPAGWAEYCLQKKDELEKLLDERVNLVVVDDGSKEKDSFEGIKGHCKLIRMAKNSGKGAALRTAFTQAETPVTVFTDADFPYELKSIQAIVEEIRSGADVALGHREEDYYKSVPWFRKGLSEAFRFVLKGILKFPITDTQCGLKGMNTRGKEVFLKTRINRFLVDMEFIKLATREKRMRVNPVVVHLRPNVEFSSMGLGVLIPELMNFLRILFR